MNTNNVNEHVFLVVIEILNRNSHIHIFGMIKDYTWLNIDDIVWDGVKFKILSLCCETYIKKSTTTYIYNSALTSLKS